MKKILFILSLIFSISTFAAPREIIMIRHADKWEQKSPGPFLSPKGQLRAEKFVGYYLKHFPKPDFIFACKPKNPNETGDSDSVRPLQTVMPLANQLAYHNPKGFVVYFPYYSLQYKKLTHQLLNDKKYADKTILICWRHSLINHIAKALGVTEQLKKWRGNDFDQVYVLNYDHAGSLASFKILKNQYPVTNQDVHWR